jgi:N-acetylglucosaminyldiphosphoundecaprenol N-acetyl-beta-D-mannosaminyltransferase
MIGTPKSGRRERLALLRAVINKIDIVHSEAEEDTLLARIARSDHPLVVSFINQHALNLVWRSPEFAACLLRSDLLLRDGVGMEVCLTVLRRSVGRNMNGTDFIPRLAAAFTGRRVALFGTAEPWTSRAAKALEKLGCKVVSVMDGFRPDAAYLAEVTQTAPDLVLLSMGNPKQESVAAALVAATTHPMVILNGGALADFLAQRFERAPVWVRRARSEWIFRLLLEPKRLWRRYLLGSFSFAWHVLSLRMFPQ